MFFFFLKGESQFVVNVSANSCPGESVRNEKQPFLPPDGATLRMYDPSRRERRNPPVSLHISYFPLHLPCRYLLIWKEAIRRRAVLSQQEWGWSFCGAAGERCTLILLAGAEREWRLASVPSVLHAGSQRAGLQRLKWTVVLAGRPPLRSRGGQLGVGEARRLSLDGSRLRRPAAAQGASVLRLRPELSLAQLQQGHHLLPQRQRPEPAAGQVEEGLHERLQTHSWKTGDLHDWRETEPQQIISLRLLSSIQRIY